MALISSAQSGNFNATSTWTGGVVPGVGDEARVNNGHTVTITANATCDEVSNAGTGIFILNDGVTLTANVTNKSTTTSRDCLQFTANTPAAATITGNISAGTVSTAVAVRVTGTGQLNITGNISGGSGANCWGVLASSTSMIVVTGNCAGGSGSSAHALYANGAATCNVTGNVTAGNTSNGFWNQAAGSATITGNVTGSTSSTGIGAINQVTGTITITGISTAGTNGIGVSNLSTGTVYLGRAKGNAYGPGNTSSLSATVGAANAGLGVIEIKELEYGDYGMSPTSGTGIRLKKASTNVAIFNYVDSGSAKTLIDATANAAMPAASDVRSGVSYASGALAGTCAVPAAGSVALGVPVDATTGTAFLSQNDVLAAVWGASTSSLTTAGSIGERLKNAATVATTGEQLATALTAP